MFSFFDMIGGIFTAIFNSGSDDEYRQDWDYNDMDDDYYSDDDD
jgi:hypothetical protein